jgi:TRAP-type C4-dicarboxylate transport system substrate-binding protein
MIFNRRRVLVLAGGAIAAPAVLRIGRAQAAETLKLHHFLPPVSNVPANFLKPWAEKVEKETDGALKIRLYPSMQLGGAPPQLYDQARDGVADIIWTIPGYTPGRFPRLEVFELPFVSAKLASANARAVQEFAAANLAEELKEAHPLAVWAHDAGVIHAKREVHKLEDIRGLKLRFPTRLAGEALKAVGVNAIGMPVPQVPESLAQGVIDGCVIPWEVVPGLKVQELVEHHTEFPGTPTFYVATMLLVMNKPRYEGLPAELRKVLDANSGMAAATMAGAALDAGSASARKKAADRGNEIFTLPDDEASRWQQATQPVVDAWVKATPDGAKLLEQARSLIAKYAQA